MSGKEWDPASDSDESIGLMLSLISLVAEPLRMPSEEAVKNLTPEERVEISLWCGNVHLAASDNDDVVPGPIPECLDSILAVRYADPLPDVETDIWGHPV